MRSWCGYVEQACEGVEEADGPATASGSATNRLSRAVARQPALSCGVAGLVLCLCAAVGPLARHWRRRRRNFYEE